MDQQTGDRRKSMDEGQQKMESVEVSAPPGITREEAEKKIPGIISEWFGLLDIEVRNNRNGIYCLKSINILFFF
jgi:hypothetical protein